MPEETHDDEKVDDDETENIILEETGELQVKNNSVLDNSCEEETNGGEVNVHKDWSEEIDEKAGHWPQSCPGVWDCECSLGWEPCQIECPDCGWSKPNTLKTQPWCSATLPDTARDVCY